MTEERLVWEAHSIQPLQNLIMHTKLGSVDTEEVKHVTKIGVHSKNGILIDRTTLLSYGDVVVLPLLFVLVDQVMVVSESNGEEEEFYCPSSSQFFATVLSTAGAVSEDRQLALLPMAAADSKRNLLNTAPRFQHAAAVARQDFTRVWTRGVMKMDEYVVFTNDEVLHEAQRQGEAIMRRKRECSQRGERAH